MTFSVTFVHFVNGVAVRQTISDLSHERSERMSSQTAEMIRDVRVLVSFYAVREDGSVSNEPLYKEKVCVPLSKGHHKDLTEFKSHIISFTDIKAVAVQKGLGKALTQTLPVYQRIAKVV